MLDEIVCLGSNLPNDKHRVTGIALHVERSGENPTYSLTFRREVTSVVQIGRRSGHDEPDKGQNAPLTSAMFRCAVVSRKHAKIIFSDSGHAYIIDSGSHHGTHLRKLGDPIPRILKPETSTLLNDGDTVTFGKAVGKGDEWVKPVVALVQLLYTTTPFNALTVPSPSSSEKSKSSSGRYGLHDSTSSEDLYSDSSDIEEISPPESSPTMTSEKQEPQATTTTTTTATSDQKPLDNSQDLVQETAAYSALKRLFSPAIKRLPSVNEIIGEKGASLFDAASKPFPTLSIFPVPQIRRQDDANVSSFETRRRVINELILDSRSSSPMDLGSPEPLAGVDSRQLSIPILTPVIESACIPLLPFLDWQLGRTPPPSGVSGPTSLSPGGNLHDGPRPEDNAEPLSAPVPDPHLTTDETKENASTASEIAEIQRTLKQIEASVSKLQVSRRKYKNRFNANVNFMSNKLSEIDDKFAEVDAEYNVLCDQVEEIQHGDLPDFARQIEDLNAIIADRDDNTFRPLELPSSPPMPVEDMTVSIKLLNDLIDEQRAFYSETQERITSHLMDMAIAREEAMRVIEQAEAILAAPTSATDLSRDEFQVRSLPMIVSTTESIQVVNKRPPQQTPVPKSLKRKRDEMDEDEGASVGQAESAQVVSADDPVTGTADGETNVTMTDLPAGMDREDSTCRTANETEVPVNVQPPRKKIRTVGSVVAQTATAVTIGAVITWSALAFC